MDSNRIEKKAVTEVERIFLDKAKTINPEVESGDKEISFDGKAILFSNREITKESYLSSIPVQVKGKEVEKFSGQTSKFYDFDKSTFKNFQREDGVVVFLVEMLKDNSRKTKTYFKFLDTNLLEEIISYLDETEHETRVIYLDELTDDLNLDKIFYDIATQRKVHNYSTIKYSSFLIQKKPLEDYSGDNFERNIISKTIENLEQLEYKNPNSQFNINLEKDMVEILSQNIIIDGILLAKTYGKIKNEKLLDKLPENLKILALLIKARYIAKTGKYSLARNICRKINIPDKLRIQYGRVWLEANYDSDNYALLIDNNVLSEQENEKRLATYKLKNNYLLDFYELYTQRTTTDTDWEYLLSYYFLQTGHFSKGSKILHDINQSLNYLELKFNELNARFLSISNDIYFGSQVLTEDLNSNLLGLLDEIENEREKLTTYDYIEFPMLEQLSFEIKIIVNPKKGFKEVENLLLNDENDYDLGYLLECKIKALFLLEEYKLAVDLINNLPNDQITEDLIIFKTLINIKEGNIKEVLDFVKDFFEDNIVIESKRLFGFLTQIYINLASNFDGIDNKIFDLTISNISKKYMFDFPLLLSLEHARKRIGSEKYRASFVSIVKQFSVYPDLRKKKYIEAFLIQNNELALAEDMYMDISEIDQLLADEILAHLYFYNNKNQKALELLYDYSDSDLSEKLLILKTKLFNELGQFRATIQLYNSSKNLSDAFLTQVLIAKIYTDDREDIELITEKGISSNDRIFKSNAAIALINFSINESRGVQILERYVLEENFNDSQLNQAYLASHLKNTKKIESNKTIDLYNNITLKWYKFKSDERTVEIILVPEGWNIKSDRDCFFYSTDSEFKFLVQDLSIGESITFKGNQYKLLEDKLLSTFVFQEAMKRESGGIGSDKTFYSIEIGKEGKGLNNLIEFMRAFDNTDKHNQINQYYEQFHAPFIYDKIISAGDMFEFYLQIFNDDNQKYYIGSEIEFNKSNKYQISLSSLATLASLDLLDILEYYPKVFIEKTQKTWLENKFSEEIENSSVGRLNLVEDKLVLNEKTDEQKKKIKKIYQEVAIISRKLKVNNVGLINSRVASLLSFDESSVQAAIDEKSILLSEDQALQIILTDQSEIPVVTSVGVLISHYFINIKKDVDSYLDILNTVIKLKSAWILHEETISKLVTVIWESKDIDLWNKLENWLENYRDYFKWDF